MVGQRALRWGIEAPWGLRWICAWFVLAATPAAADPGALAPDPPPRRRAPAIGAGNLAPSWNLDGLYLWLGPIGAAGRIDAAWDTTFGADATVIRVRERAPLAALGASAGVALWSARGGGRVWLDGLAATTIAGRIAGISLGPIAELAELAHPRLGASAGVWVFAGVTPFARVGVVDETGPFVEIGLHLGLPVLRRRD